MQSNGILAVLRGIVSGEYSTPYRCCGEIVDKRLLEVLKTTNEKTIKSFDEFLREFYRTMKRTNYYR